MITKRIDTSKNKPRMRSDLEGGWLCWNQDVITGYGYTPELAYKQFLVKADRAKQARNCAAIRACVANGFALCA